jgi:hypothetical protein
MERLRQRQRGPDAGPTLSAPRFTPPAPTPPSALGNIKDAVDKVLIADFFFVLFALAWLGGGLVARSALHTTAVLDAWLSLWQWVFQPAIGVLMLGAVRREGAAFLSFLSNLLLSVSRCIACFMLPFYGSFPRSILAPCAETFPATRCHLQLTSGAVSWVKDQASSRPK